MERLKIDLEEKSKELSDARAEIASLQLRLRNELAEVNARHRDDSGIEEGWGAMQCRVWEGTMHCKVFVYFHINPTQAKV